MGKFSWSPTAGVHVLRLGKGKVQASVSFQASSVGGNDGFSWMIPRVSQDGSQPASSPLSPLPLFRWVCLPEPGAGRHPASQADTNLRNRPTVTSYLSS